METDFISKPIPAAINCRISLPVETSQTLRVLSSPPDNIYFPSGEKTAELTLPVCPLNVLISFPVATSQSLSVLSMLPDNAYLSSGEKATDPICPVCPICTKISGPCLLPAYLSTDSTLAVSSLNGLISCPVETSQSLMVLS